MQGNEIGLYLYRRMLLIRRMEERLGQVQKTGSLPGPVHLCIGQEAVATGVCAHLDAEDWITSTHRGHGHFLAKGGDPKSMVAEIYGRSTGICRGKGGSMHVADFSKGIVGANGIVGGGIGLATGAALAASLDAGGRVAVAFFGDGAAAQGVVSESLNVSALWRLPLVLVCENNGFSEYSPTSTVSAGKIHARADAYGVPSVVVDGNDVLAVWEVAASAVERARRGEGPTMIEAMTYRLRGHVEYESTFLSGPYRTEEELADWTRRDPIARLGRVLAERGVAADELQAIEDSIAGTVEEAFQYADASPWPDPATALQDMYANAA